MATEQGDRSSARRSRGPKVLRFFYGAGLFAIGACLGVVIGSLSETPRLLLERLRGPVESLDVAGVAPESAEIEPPAPPLERFGELQEGKAPAPARVPPAPPPAATEPSPAPVAAAPPSPKAAAPAAASAAPPPKPTSAAPALAPRPVVQVASHVDRKPADELAAKLRGQGFDAYVSQPRAQSGRFRVRVRPATGESPTELAKRLKSGGYDTWATSE